MTGPGCNRHRIRKWLPAAVSCCSRPLVVCVQALQQWQDLWSCLQDLDHNAWVLEPLAPTWAEPWRRVALGGHTSVTVTLNPQQPLLPPQLHFAGPAARVEPLQQGCFQRLQLWSQDR